MLEFNKKQSNFWMNMEAWPIYRSTCFTLHYFTKSRSTNRERRTAETPLHHEVGWCNAAPHLRGGQRSLVQGKALRSRQSALVGYLRFCRRVPGVHWWFCLYMQARRGLSLLGIFPTKILKMFKLRYKVTRSVWQGSDGALVRLPGRCMLYIQVLSISGPVIGR